MKMINVRKFIQRKKQKFKEFQVGVQTRKYETQIATLELERKRQAKKAKVLARKQNLQRDVQRIRGYNKKVAGPSVAAKFGKGLARVINKKREELKKSQVRGSGLDFGGRSSSPFANDLFGKKEDKKLNTKNRKITIKINE